MNDGLKIAQIQLKILYSQLCQSLVSLEAICKMPIKSTETGKTYTSNLSLITLGFHQTLTLIKKIEVELIEG